MLTTMLSAPMYAGSPCASRNRDGSTTLEVMTLKSKLSFLRSGNRRAAAKLAVLMLLASCTTLGAVPVSAEPELVIHEATPPTQGPPPNAAKQNQGIFLEPVTPQQEVSVQSIAKVNRLIAEGEKFFDEKLADKALMKWQEAYGLAIEMKYGDGQGKALGRMALVYLQQGQYPKAKLLAENATEVLLNSTEQQELGKARVTLAQAFFGLDNASWGVQQLDMAMKILTDKANKYPLDAARALNIAGTLAIKFRQPKPAVRYFQEAATFFANGGDFASAVHNREMIAQLFLELGFSTAALEEANKAVTLAKTFSGDNRGLLCPAMASLANAQYALGEFSNARKTYEDSLRLAAKLPISAFDALSRAHIDNGYAYTLTAIGDYDQAKALFSRILPVYRTHNAIPEQAQVLSTLGLIECAQGNYAKSLSYSTQSLDVQQLIQPPQARMSIVTNHNIAAAEYRSGLARMAKAHLDACINTCKKSKFYQLEGRSFTALAEVSLKLADPVNALKYANQGIALSSQIDDDGALWRDYLVQSKVQLSQGLQEEAKVSLMSALSHFRSPQAGYFASAEEIGFPIPREEAGQSLVALVASQGMGEQALLAAEQLKEESFITDWQRRCGRVKPEDAELYNDLVSQRAHMHTAENLATPNRLTKEWQNWMTRFRTLAQQNRSLARLIAPMPTAASDILKAVKQNNITILEYLVGADQTVAFTVDGAGRISASVLPVGRSRLQSQVAALMAADSSPEGKQRERALLEALYNQLLPPAVRQFLPKTADQMTMVIPDGVLFNVPFAALVDGQGKYLVETHLLTLAPSVGVLFDPQPIAVDLSMVVASVVSDQSNAERVEADKLTTIFQPDRISTFLSKDADLGSMQEQAKNKAVVHLPASVALQEVNPWRSVLPFFSSKEQGAKRATLDRLFESSLPSELIVLSGSSLSSKEQLGNAVEVFSRGLSYAGARNVVLSLWAQPSATRIDELLDFYRNKQSGLNPAQSLRKAQLLALSKDPSPKSWAGYQLLGPGN